MSELLLELFSEEIPARLQTRAADDLRRLMVDGLKAKGLDVGEARAFATPRRLALVVADVLVVVVVVQALSRAAVMARPACRMR